MSQMEIGVECSCGFKRRATKVSAGGEKYNGREIEGFHFAEIAREVAEMKNGEPPPRHSMSVGLTATMDWSPVTDTEQRIGEAYYVGYWDGQTQLRTVMKAKLARVTAEEFSR